jgi:hypothetical protein
LAVEQPAVQAEQVLEDCRTQAQEQPGEHRRCDEQGHRSGELTPSGPSYHHMRDERARGTWPEGRRLGRERGEDGTDGHDHGEGGEHDQRGVPRELNGGPGQQGAPLPPSRPALRREAGGFIEETRATVPYRRKCSQGADTPLPVSSRTVKGTAC